MTTTARRTSPDVPDDPEELQLGRIADGVLLEDARVLEQDLSVQTLHQFVARGSVLESVSFANARLQSVRFRDVRFIRCDFSNAVLQGLTANRVEFFACRLTGIKAIECRLDNVLWEQCEASYAQLTNGVLKTCEFIDTRMQDADLRTVNLENTGWNRVDLTRADLSGTSLKGVDLRGASIEGMVVNAGDLAGAVVNPSQAMDLARLLGLTIR